MKLILGLVWMLIQKYHIQAEDARRAMLDWIQVQYLCCVFLKFNKRVQIVNIRIYSFLKSTIKSRGLATVGYCNKSIIKATFINNKSHVLSDTLNFRL